MTKRRAYPKMIFPTLNEPARYVFDPEGGWRRLNPHYSWAALSVREQQDLESYLNWIGMSKKSTKFPQFERGWTLHLPYEDSSFNWNQRNWYWEVERGDEIWEWSHILQNNSISTEEEEWDWENDDIVVILSKITNRIGSNPQRFAHQEFLIENLDEFKKELVQEIESLSQSWWEDFKWKLRFSDSGTLELVGKKPNVANVLVFLKRRLANNQYEMLVKATPPPNRDVIYVPEEEKEAAKRIVREIIGTKDWTVRQRKSIQRIDGVRFILSSAQYLTFIEPTNQTKADEIWEKIHRIADTRNPHNRSLNSIF